MVIANPVAIAIHHHQTHMPAAYNNAVITYSESAAIERIFAQYRSIVVCIIGVYTMLIVVVAYAPQPPPPIVDVCMTM